MGDGAGMPELRDDAAAGSVHGVGDPAPSQHLLRAPQARRIGPAEAIGADRGGFGDDKSGRSALGVIFGLQRGRHVIGLTGAHAGERRHDDAIRQIEVAHADRGKERLVVD